MAGVRTVSTVVILFALTGCSSGVVDNESTDTRFQDPLLTAQISTLTPAGVGTAHNTAVRSLVDHILPRYLREPTDTGKYHLLRNTSISYLRANFTSLTSAEVVRTVDAGLELVIRRIGPKGRFWEFRRKENDFQSTTSDLTLISSTAEGFVAEILQVAEDPNLDTGFKHQRFSEILSAALSVLSDPMDIDYVTAMASVAGESLSMWDASLQGALAGNGDPLWASIFLEDGPPSENQFQDQNFSCGVICRGLIKLAKVVGTDVMGGIGGFLTGGGTPEAALLGATLASTALMLSEI